MPASPPLIAITLGDPFGIGPEIIAKALADPAIAALGRFDLYGGDAADPARAVRLTAALPLVPGRSSPASAALPGPTAAGGRASFDALMAAINACKLPEGDPRRPEAIVTAPIAKEAWHRAGITFPGHTEVLASAFASPRTAMLFVGPSLRVILATIHVALSEVPRLLTSEKVWNVIDLGAQACRELGVASPRVGVAGLNPHAGEGGLFGDEDARVIAPAVARARSEGIDASGPIPGDAVFLAAAKGRYDLVVAMYHDQGLIPVKLLDREAAVNVTVGLRWPEGPEGRSIIRTSPAHGTAYDIAGRGVADASSMKSAIALAAEMIGRRERASRA